VKKSSSFLIFIPVILLTTVSAWAIYSQRPFRTRMAGYVTDLKDRSSAQRHNILRAGRAFSGIVLQEGEVFSLNQLAGPYTLDRGFLAERSFQGEEIVWTPGGGVCQLASTLFNAARLADLQILERVPHSRPVESVPPGRDATLAYGVADLKFRNNHPYPIKIVSKEIRNQLLIEIWGKEKAHGSSQL